MKLEECQQLELLLGNDSIIEIAESKGGALSTVQVDYCVTQSTLERLHASEEATKIFLKYSKLHAILKQKYRLQHYPTKKWGSIEPEAFVSSLCGFSDKKYTIPVKSKNQLKIAALGSCFATNISKSCDC